MARSFDAAFIGARTVFPSSSQFRKNDAAQTFFSSSLQLPSSLKPHVVPAQPLCMKSPVPMQDRNKRIFLVTGSTDGIGRHTALRLAAERGHTVLVHGRNAKKGADTVKFITSKTGNPNVDFFCADLSDLKQIHRLSDEIRTKYDRCDVLINNAGVFEDRKQLSADGLELTFAINVVAPFLLTKLLLDLLECGSSPRIVNTASISQAYSFDFENLNGQKSYSAHQAYSLSKLCNVMFTYELDRRLRASSSGITTNCLDPGTVNTKMLLQGWGPIGIPVDRANDEYWLATAPELEGVSGKYFVSRTPSRSSPDAQVQEKCSQLWQFLESLVGSTFL
mmetsp:Transcript_7066/g.11153  ORF Transcript_7066/g.11153 Transcript_7066/m.11153 type:complete len:335 (-) Transcript_7066:408-1412(-)